MKARLGDQVNRHFDTKAIGILQQEGNQLLKELNLIILFTVIGIILCWLGNINSQIPDYSESCMQIQKKNYD